MAKYKDHLKGSFAMALEQAAQAKGTVAALAEMQRWADKELGDRRRKVSDEQAAEIFRQLSEGRSCYAVAGNTGISAPTVRRLARKRPSRARRT